MHDGNEIKRYTFGVGIFGLASDVLGARFIIGAAVGGSGLLALFYQVIHSYAVTPTSNPMRGTIT